MLDTIFPSWSDLGVDVHTATSNTWDNELARASKFWYYYSGFIFKETVQDVAPGDDPPLMYPIGVNLVKMLCLAHADSAFGDYRGIPITFEPRADDEITDEDRSASRLARTILLDSKAPTLMWELELERQLYGGSAMKVAVDLTKPSGLRWHRIPKGNFFPIWDPADPEVLLEVYIVTWLTEDQASAKYGYMKTGSKDFIPRVEHWTRHSVEVKMEDEVVFQQSNVWGVPPFVYIPRYRLDNWWGESITQDLMEVQNEVNMRLGDIGEAINYNSHPILWGHNLPMAFDQDNYPIGSSTMWDLGRTIGNSPEPQVGALQIDTPVPQAAFDHIEFLYDWARTSTFAPPIAFGEDEGGGQRSGITLEIRMWPLIKAVQRSRSYLFVALRQAMDISARILLQKKLKGMDMKAVENIKSGVLEPKFQNVLPRDHAADVDEVVKLLATRVPSISLETVQEVLGRGSPEVARILEMIKDPVLAKFFEEAVESEPENESKDETL